MINRENKLKYFDERITEFLLIIYFLFLIILPVVSIVSLVLLTVYCCFSGKMVDSFRIIKKDHIFKLFLGYYLLHVIGLFYSTNLQYGFSDLETKLSFFIIPIVYSGLNISEKIFEKIKLTFILSSTLSLFVLLILSAIQFSNTSDWNEFFYTRLTHVGHATYISVYFNLALLFIQDHYYKNKSRSSFWILVLLFFFLLTGIFLLSARTSTFVAILSVIIYPFLITGKKLFHDKKFKVHLSGIFLMLILFFTYLHFNNRFLQVEHAIVLIENQNSTDSVRQEDPNSTNIRINLWQNAIQLIGENILFGVGTGDIKEELVKKYSENNYQYGVRIRPSPHNQFLHTGVILGLTGILFLLAYLLLPLAISFRQKDWLYFAFLIIILINCMTESLLERQAGILFFTAFNTCFYLLLRKNLAIVND
jgi:O-antigen ligase